MSIGFANRRRRMHVHIFECIIFYLCNFNIFISNDLNRIPFKCLSGELIQCSCDVSARGLDTKTKQKSDRFSYHDSYLEYKSNKQKIRFPLAHNLIYRAFYACRRVRLELPFLESINSRRFRVKWLLFNNSNNECHGISIFDIDISTPTQSVLNVNARKKLLSRKAFYNWSGFWSHLCNIKLNTLWSKLT